VLKSGKNNLKKFFDKMVGGEYNTFAYNEMSNKLIL